MAANNVFWGIEIGASSIKAIKLERVDDVVKVLDFAVIQHPKPLSTPGVDANDVLRVSLGTLASQYDLSKAGIAVSVPGHAAFARFTKLPPVEKKRVPDVVKFEAMQQIPFPLEEVEWDYQVFSQDDSPDVGAGIFAITKERVNERLSMLAELGLTPDVLTISPLSVYNAMAYDLEFTPTTPGTIIVDIGTTSTDIIIAEPGRMWIRTFPIGGHQFTDAVVNQFQLSYPKAEKIKREAEDSKHARQVFQAMRPVFTDLATEVQRSIGYYQALHKDANLTRLVGVGSTFRLPGLRKYFKQQLSIEVYRIEEFKRAKLADDAPAERVAQFNDAALNLCTAYGLAVQGLELNACAGNLMPVAVLRDSMWAGKTKWFVGAAACAIFASGAMFIRPVMDNVAVKARPVDASIQRAVSEASRLTNMAKEAGVTGEGQPDMKAANMVELLNRRNFYPHIVNDVALIFQAGDDAARELKGEGGQPLPTPVFSLLRLDTTYKGPSAVPDAAIAGSPDQPGLELDGETADSQQYPRVRCEMYLLTDAPEPLRFARDTVGKWLRAQAGAVRPGVPYVIVPMEPSISVADAREAALPTGNEGGDSGFVPGGRLGRRSNNPLAEMAAERERAEAPSGGGGELVNVTKVENVDQIAPLAVPAAPKPKTLVTVRWLAVVQPPKPAEPGAEGGQK